MRFWLGLIIVTVLVSGAITWLWLNQGAQLEDDYVELGANLPRGSLALDGPVMTANVIEFKPGDTHMDETKSIEIPFRNAGEGPLRIEFLRSSCKCLDGISVDDVKLTAGGPPAVKAPGEAGKIKVQWTPKKDSCQECDKKKLLISIELYCNDPRPQFARPFRVEIETKVLPKAS